MGGRAGKPHPGGVPRSTERMGSINSWKRQAVVQERTRRVQNGAQAMAHAALYGLVHDLAEAIARNHSRGWADGDLTVFRLEDDGEVRDAWRLVEERRRARDTA
jgi:hypothetical protein